MKANEVPEKLYVHVKKGKVLNIWNSQWIGVNDIEYTRTDAFIDKACEWLESLYAPNGSIAPCHVHLIEDFKKYMKGK